MPRWTLRNRASGRLLDSTEFGTLDRLIERAVENEAAERLPGGTPRLSPHFVITLEV